MTPEQAAKWERLLQGEQVVASEKDMEAFEAVDNDVVKRLTSVRNPIRCGILDPYIVSIRPMQPLKIGRNVYEVRCVDPVRAHYILTGPRGGQHRIAPDPLHPGLLARTTPTQALLGLHFRVVGASLVIHYIPGNIRCRRQAGRPKKRRKDMSEKSAEALALEASHNTAASLLNEIAADVAVMAVIQKHDPELHDEIRQVVSEWSAASSAWLTSIESIERKKETS
jgi:hypothetical protein